jgi:hypothetical protein
MVTFRARTISEVGSYSSAEDGISTSNMNTADGTPAPNYADLVRTIEALQARINQLESTQERRSPPPPPPAGTPAPPVKRPRPTQAHPEPYDHTKPELFPQFESKLQAKLVIDAEAIGGPFEQLWYAFGCLKDNAAARIHPWMQVYGKDRFKVSEGTLNLFFDELQFAFQDAQLQQKALVRLNTLRQGRRDFREFLGEFEQLLLEAGGHQWDNNVKRGYLDAAINQDMRKALISIDKKAEFTAYCRQLQEIAIRIEECNRIDNARAPRKAKATVPLPHPTTAPAADPMDWVPAGAELNPMKPRAKWVSAEDYKKRKKDKRCLRCGATGHQIKDCPYRGAVPPKPRVAAVKAHEPELDKDEDAVSAAGDSGKE